MWLVGGWVGVVGGAGRIAGREAGAGWHAPGERRSFLSSVTKMGSSAIAVIW